VTVPRNPFRPTFGVSPPELVGREEQRTDFHYGLLDGPGAPARATIYTGARGTGKTVLLNAIEEDSRERGWLVVAETATPGLIDRLVSEHLPRLLAGQDPKATRTRLSGVSGPAGFGARWDTTDAHPALPGLRSQISELCEMLAQQGTGLLITVDELHRKPLPELVALFTVIQHAFREELELAFAGAGLPSAVSDLLSEDVLTFLRRAERHELGRLSQADAEQAISNPVLALGRSFEDSALAIAAGATGGYPFLIQLVGYWVWRQNPGRNLITVQDATAGSEQALQRLGSLLHAPALAACSEVDRAFLATMALDEGPSRIAQIAQRMGVGADYANVYRARLIDAQLIEPAGRGRVAFALPGLREYLRERDVVAEE
jgi:hypothetical protein